MLSQSIVVVRERCSRVVYFVEMCVENLYLKCVFWNFPWNVCVCVCGNCMLECMCWNCTWNVYVETVLEICVLKLPLKCMSIETAPEKLRVFDNFTSIVHFKKPPPRNDPSQHLWQPKTCGPGVSNQLKISCCHQQIPWTLRKIYFLTRPMRWRWIRWKLIIRQVTDRSNGKPLIKLMKLMWLCRIIRIDENTFWWQKNLSSLQWHLGEKVRSAFIFRIRKIMFIWISGDVWNFGCEIVFFEIIWVLYFCE